MIKELTLGIEAGRGLKSQKEKTAGDSFIIRQKRLLDELQGEPHPRRIVWHVDETGNTGKTYMTRYLMCNERAIRLQRPYGLLGTGEPRTSTSTFTQLLSLSLIHI